MAKHRRPPRTHQVRGTLLLGSVATSLAVGLTAVFSPSLSVASDDRSGTPAIVTASLPTVEAPIVEQPREEPAPQAPAVPPPPPESGEGRRVVFDQGDQRVWLIEADGTVTATYLVSGSRFDNLDPGSYAVRARYRHATSFDNSGTMEYFVEFTTGWSEPIGFHSIPVDNAGNLEQSVDELGRPLSAGCIRQKPEDAAFLWDWAPLGTPVVVTA
ncbi:L,D-transpeptidase [uncultured Aeromicrobium sp.]|uniref:L,D-transpeptidase n=1 Tax=uncultured Aeromicrobium sp. TaxID=337820 RepID=UPI0025DEC375|nr:L,D-transpeptidase [uncultured Aeromicrobium sp.]